MFPRDALHSWNFCIFRRMGRRLSQPAESQANAGRESSSHAAESLGRPSDPGLNYTQVRIDSLRGCQYRQGAGVRVDENNALSNAW